MALENMIARMAATRIDASGVERIACYHREDNRGHGRQRHHDLIALNELFHDAIHEISRCSYLQRILVGQRVYVRTACQDAMTYRSPAIAFIYMLAGAAAGFRRGECLVNDLFRRVAELDRDGLAFDSSSSAIRRNGSAH
jgi:hypothetical protein